MLYQYLEKSYNHWALFKNCIKKTIYHLSNCINREDTMKEKAPIYSHNQSRRNTLGWSWRTLHRTPGFWFLHQKWWIWGIAGWRAVPGGAVLHHEVRASPVSRWPYGGCTGRVYSLRNTSMGAGERAPQSYLLLCTGPGIEFPAPMWQLTAMCNSSSDTLLTTSGTACMLCAHIHADTKYNKNIFKKKYAF